MQVWKIEWLLRETLKCDDPVLQNMAVLMMEKFGKYWSDHNVILSIAMILDPRMKLEALRFYYSKLDASTCDEKINNIKEKMYKLFDEYVSVKSSSSTASSSQQPTVQEDFSIEENQEMDDPYNEYINYVSQNVNVNGKSELDLYLAETPLEPKFFPKLDILSYWKDRQERYPNLCRLACKVLSILITTVASESTYNIGARVLNKYRASLLPSNVQTLILTQNWINGFEDIGHASDPLPDGHAPQPRVVPQAPQTDIPHVPEPGASSTSVEELRHAVEVCDEIAERLERHLSLGVVTPGSSTHEVIEECLRMARSVT
eukprot:XP_014622189.1 zinc finger BED domain-containing protein DAYSLEEPER [Glycine max]